MTAAPVSHKKTILVVVDDAGVRSLTMRILEEHGYRVIEASNGFDARSLLESTAGRIDLVVSDVVMPRLDVIELARCIKILPHPPPILLMSGYGLSALEFEWPLLVKPFGVDELLAAVHLILAAPGEGDPLNLDASRLG
jgi:two-component system, cell cycle sensor histidine kinase and response regulator CckA